jgi:hypothetical protein
MKFLSAAAVHGLIGLTLAAGIVLAAHGRFWLLLVGAAVYLAGLIKFGFLTH